MQYFNFSVGSCNVTGALSLKLVVAVNKRTLVYNLYSIMSQKRSITVTCNIRTQLLIYHVVICVLPGAPTRVVPK